ncbi:MAG: type II methionyl aminopeptidase [Nanoarchaeota archaeon]
MSEKFNLEILEELGKFTKKLRKQTSKLIKKGTKISEIINFVEKSIFDAKCLPAFPCTVCINDVAAHYTIFDEDYEIKKGDVVKIDFGISKDGFITDNAFTIEIETNRYKEILDANFDALNKQLELVSVGISMSELGRIPENNAAKVGCQTIHNLSGHQIERNNLHVGLSVPNYENKNLSRIQNNSCFAIEPYFSLGSNLIKEGQKGNILELTGTGPVRDVIAKTVLNHIKKKFSYLPFSKRWLLQETSEYLGLGPGFEKNKLEYALKILKKEKRIYEHSRLVSIDGSINTQFEDTVLIINGEKKIITRLD